MAKHPPAETYDEIIARLISEMPDAKWLPPAEAAKGLEKLYRRTDPRKLTEKIRKNSLAILIEYPKEKTALNLLSVCNAALDSGDYCEARIEAIREAYRDIDPDAWEKARGGHNRAKLYEAEKIAAREIANEIWAKRTHKPTIRELWGMVAKKQHPDLSGEALEKMSESLRQAAIRDAWKPSD